MLKVDFKRQAVDSQRGYNYQTWQSIYRWIMLEKDEELYLEGAEDFDVYSTSGVETVQVKDTKKSGPVTLRSEAIIKSIANFWSLQEKNPTIKIHFRFLTTSDRGYEKSSPFAGKNGLDYWDLCRNIETDLNPLRNFLKKQKGFPDSLYDFIHISNDLEFREKLIFPMEWDTGNEQREFIKDLVIKRICYYGEQFGIPPSESIKVVPHLAFHIHNIICMTNDRKLNYYDFMIIFENATSERVSKTDLDQLRRSQHLLNQLILPENRGDHLSQSTIITGCSFDDIFSFHKILPDKIAPRLDIIKCVSNFLENYRFIVLRGSTGMGKSTIASLIKKMDDHNWTWFGLRGFEPIQIRDIFYKTALSKTLTSGGAKLIIDDLNFDRQTDIYENALAGLLYATFSSSGYVIITTQGDVPARIKSWFKLGEESYFEVPPLDEREIIDFIKLYGCPKTLRKAWGTLLLGKTRGHPQLVDAWVRKLQALKWPSPFQTDISEADDIEFIKRNARRTLTEQVPSDSARLLAYRLSILGQPFRRDHAIEIASMKPNILFPGEAFDLLIGPWINKLSSDYFQISPLLEDSAKEIWEEEEITRIHAHSAECYVKCEPRTLLEVKGAIFHGLAGNSEPSVIYPLISLIKESHENEIWSRIVPYFIWLAPIKLNSIDILFPKNIYISVMLRLFQFKIASSFDKKVLPHSISEVWENEIDSISEPDLKKYMRVLFLAETIIRFEIYFPPKLIISRIIELLELINDPLFHFLPKQYNSHHEFSLPELLITFVTPRCKDSTDAIEFFTTIINTSSKDDSLLTIIRDNRTLINNILNKVWMNEAEKELPDWNKCIKLLNEFIKIGFSGEIENLSIEAYRAIAIIQDEYLDNTSAAVITLEKARNCLLRDDPIIEDEHATILLHQDKYKEALSIWKAILPELSQPLCEVLIFSFRKAQICAGKIGDWDTVENLAMLGAKAARIYDLPDKPSLIKIGYLADYAFALWKNGNFSQSINMFAEVLSSFDMMPDPSQNLRSYTLQKLVGHVIAWISQEMSNDIGLAEPGAGCFSNPNVNEEIKQYQLYPDIFLWDLLANVEHDIKSGDSILKEFEERSERCKFPTIKHHLIDLKIRNFLRTNVLNFLVDYFIKFISYHYYCISYCHTKDEIFNEIDSNIDLNWHENIDNNIKYLQDLLFSGLIVMLTRNDYSLSIIDDWKTSISKYGLWNEEFEKWLSFAKQGFDIDLSNHVNIIKDPQSKFRALASLFILAWDRGDPEVLFYANYLLLAFATKIQWRKQIEDDIEKMTIKTWVRVVSEQPFSILIPTMNIPDILKECESSTLGFKKVARILLNVEKAIKLYVHQEIISQLKSLAEV